MRKDNSREIMDAVMLNTEYEADIKVHQGREFNMYEKPETREVIDNITDAVMLKHGVRGWRQGPPRQGVQPVQEVRDEGWDAQDQPQGQVRQEHERQQRDEQEQRGRPYQRPEMRAVMADIIDAVMINMYEKPETRDVMDDITDAVMLKHGVRGWQLASRSSEEGGATCARRPRRGRGCSRPSSRASPARTRR